MGSAFRAATLSLHRHCPRFVVLPSRSANCGANITPSLRTANRQDTMNAFTTLLNDHPLVFFHLLSAVGALALGIVILSRRKGTTSHRTLGWAWVLLMSVATITSAFLNDASIPHPARLPNIAGFTPIHAFTALVAVQLPRAILAIRRGNVSAHQRAMKRIFIGGCVVAGLFTLLPGRFLGNMLWQSLGVA
jgi:uncharacterized membrane protein